jgi:hypothetical protein
VSKFLRLTEVKVRVGLAESTLYAKVVRKVMHPSDDAYDEDAEEAKQKACMVFGPNGIEVP